MTNEADKPSVEGLKPCPFCGGKAAFVPRAVNLALQKDPSDPKFGVSVICGTCSAETGNFIDETAASLRWNRRPSNRSVEGLMELVQDHGDYCRDELPEAAARELTAIRAYAERLASEAAPAAQPATSLREVLSDEQERGNRIEQRLALLEAGDYINVDEFAADVRALLAASSDEDRKLMEQALAAMENLHKGAVAVWALGGSHETSEAIAALRSRLDGTNAGEPTTRS